MTTGRVDVHAHYLPADYRQALLDAGHEHPDGFPVLPEWSAATHLAMMDRVGIATSMLSVSTPGVTFGADAVEWARRVNESGAQTVREHPGRFGLFASLPLPDVDAARDELGHALDELEADGVVLLTHADGVYLGDPRLEPVMAELHRRRAIVFVHPTSPAGFQCTALGYPRPMLEFLLDTTRAIANLVLTGTFARYPDIRLIVPHAGAALPVLADRLAGFAGLFGVGGREAGEVDVLGTLQRLYYEVGAGFPFPRHVDALLNLVDAGRLLYGTDFPFGGLGGIEANAEALAAYPGIDERDLRATAEALFPAAAAVVSAFAAGPGYLDTASVGVPPVATVDAMHEVVRAWGAGEVRPPDFDAVVAAARASFARIVGVADSDVCIGSQVSALAGLVAAAVPDGARIVAAEGDFTSVLFPFLAQADRGVEVAFAPLAGLADAIDGRTALVAVSAVQSADGAVADLDAIAAAAAVHGSRTFVDGTQACGWLPLDAGRFDFLACAAYKWLMSPRGSAFMTVRRERLAEIRPNAAGWYAGEDVWSSIYGAPLRLAHDARRLDTSPAWMSWVGTVPSLALVERTGVDAIHAHDVGLANRLRAGLGLPPGDSAIVRVEAPGAPERLAAAGIQASTRAGAARLAFHVHNTEADADLALEALA